VVSGAKRLLLHDRRKRLPHDESTGDDPDAAPDTFPDTASNPSPDAAAHTPCHPWRSCGSLQLRCRRREHVATGQEGLVLPYSPPRVPTNCAAPAAHLPTTNANAHPATGAADRAGEACRSVQLRRWLRELASRLVSAKEGVVLPRSWQGLSKPGRRLCHIVGAIRL